MHSRYAIEKLSSAVRSLCLSIEPLQQRLISVCRNDLGHIVIDRDMPPDLRVSFREFMESLRMVTPNADEGLFEATISAMNDIDALKTLETILHFHRRTIEHFATQK